MDSDTPRDAALLDQGYELIETHISRVYLSPTQVFKLKRPVNLGFLDFSTASARRAACEAEVELNRRLAPDVYLGVVALVHGADGQLGFAPPEQVHGRVVLDWGVQMHRLADEARADRRLEVGSLDLAELEDIARLLVRFHAAARHDESIARFGRLAAVRFNVEENFRQIAELAQQFVTAEELATLEADQRRFLGECAARLEQRADAGFVRDGHGDLRLEHIYRSASGGHVVIDCIEFNDRFRYADVCADLAFLSMDLRAHGRPDLAELLLAAYARESGDYALYTLVDFYESYRAVVRAKVSSLLANDPHVSEAARERAARSARRYYLLALAAARPSLERPRLIVCMGKMASGKSTLAQALGAKFAAPVLAADPTRKQLLGVEETAPLHHAPFAGAYSAELSARVYETLRERAGHVLRSGRSAILDATFGARKERALAAQLAAQLGLDVIFLVCACERSESLARLKARQQGPHVSDGRLEIYDQVSAQFQPIEPTEAGMHLMLDTNAPLPQTLARALTELVP